MAVSTKLVGVVMMVLSLAGASTFEIVNVQRDALLPYYGGLALTLDVNATCPSSTTTCSANNETIGISTQCCPTGTICSNDGVYCCPTNTDYDECSSEISTHFTCGDPSWILWADPAEGYCCLKNQVLTPPPVLVCVDAAAATATITELSTQSNYNTAPPPGGTAAVGGGGGTVAANPTGTGTGGSGTSTQTGTQPSATKSDGARGVVACGSLIGLATVLWTLL